MPASSNSSDSICGVNMPMMGWLGFDRNCWNPVIAEFRSENSMGHPAHPSAAMSEMGTWRIPSTYPDREVIVALALDAP